jgi:hypothetical protein
MPVMVKGGGGGGGGAPPRTGYVWLRIETSGGLLWTRDEPSDSIKYGEFLD